MKKMEILISEMKRTISDIKKEYAEDIKTGMFFYNLMHMNFFLAGFLQIEALFLRELQVVALEFSIFGAINYIVYMVIRLYSLYKNKR